MDVLNCPTCSQLVDFNSVAALGCCPKCSTFIFLDSTLLANYTEMQRREELLNKNALEADERIPQYKIPHSCYTVNVLMNGHNVQFLVDTGAQSSILPLDTAIACELDELIDRRKHGKLVGVGEDRIMGYIHCIDIVFKTSTGPVEIPSAFTVNSNARLEPLLGMDFLKSHRCIIDIHNRKLTTDHGEIELKEKHIFSEQ